MKVRKYIPSPEAELVRAFRTRANLTQTDFSEQLGYQGNICSLWEGGQNRVPLRTIHEIVDLLDLTIEEMNQLRDARKLPWTRRQLREITWTPVTATVSRSRRG